MVTWGSEGTKDRRAMVKEGKVGFQGNGGENAKSFVHSVGEWYVCVNFLGCVMDVHVCLYIYKCGGVRITSDNVPCLLPLRQGNSADPMNFWETVSASCLSIGALKRCAHQVLALHGF